MPSLLCSLGRVGNNPDGNTDSKEATRVILLVAQIRQDYTDDVEMHG